MTGQTVSGYAPLLALALAVPLVASSQPPGAGAPAPELTAVEGRRLAEKLTRIIEFEARGDAAPQTVVLREREVNAYFRFQGASLLPDGVRDPRVTLGEDGQIAAHATVDLDAVAQARPRSVLDPLSYLQGTVEVTARGRLETASGMGRITVESVAVGSIPVPRLVLDELVRHYSRTETHPHGIDLDDPFPLPYRIDEVRVDTGEAVIVQ